MLQISIANGGYIFAIAVEDEDGPCGYEYFVTSSLDNLVSMVRDHVEAIESARRELHALGA